MELSQLQYFVMVSQCGKIKDAAQALNISQSGISMAISRLEEELGVELIEKDGRNIRMTKAGRTFASMVAPALASLDHAKQEIIRRKSQVLAVITLSSEDADYSNRLRIRYLQESRPKVRFLQSTDMRFATENKLISGAVDFTITYDPQDDTNIESFKILDEPAFVLLPASDAYAGAKSVCLSELKKHSFVTCPEGYGARLWFDAVCGRAGFRARVRHEETDELGVRSVAWVMQASTLVGWSSLPNAGGPDYHDRLVRAVPLEEPFCRRHLYLSYLKNRKLSPEAADFLAFVRRCAALSIATGVLPAPYDYATGVLLGEPDVGSGEDA